MAKASDSMKATFTFSKATPSAMATVPRMIVVIREPRSSGPSSPIARPEDARIKVVADALVRAPPIGGPAHGGRAKTRS
jgi:hypothetical protein